MMMMMPMLWISLLWMLLLQPTVAVVAVESGIRNTSDRNDGGAAPQRVCRYDALSVNRTSSYVQPPCVWPSKPPADVPFQLSSVLRGIIVLENATSIPGYGAE
jgi:hypothetical protein